MNKYRAKSARAKVWEAMRALRKFTIADLCQLTRAEEWNVKRYMRVLELAGYLSKRSIKGMGGRFEYQLIKNTGLKAPVQKTIRCIWDPNNGEYWIDKAVKGTAGGQ